MDFDTSTRNAQTIFIDYGLLGFNFREFGFLFCGLFCGFTLWILIRPHETHKRFSLIMVCWGLIFVKLDFCFVDYFVDFHYGF
jgi:hypothetical protein